MTFVQRARRFATLSLLGLAVSWVMAGPASAQVAAERVLPKSTIAYLKVKNAKDLRTAIKSTQLGQLLADPALNDLKADIEAKLEKAGEDFRQQIGMGLMDVLTLPQGEIALAVVPTEGRARPVAVYAVADAGEKRDQMDAFMTRATELAEKESVTATDQEFEGATLHVLQAEGDAPPVAWTNIGSVYHYATDVDVLKDIVKNGSGRSDSLGTNEAYQAIVSKAGDEAQVVWFIDLTQAGKLAMSLLKAQDEGNAMVLGNQIQLTGLDSLKGLGGGVAFNSGPYDQVARTFLYAPGEARGILPIFQMPKVDLSPEAWVPASVASYQSVSWDLDAAYEAIRAFIDQNVGPGMLDGIEQQIAGPQGDGLKFQKDIFGPLGDRISIVSDFATPGDETSQRFAIGISLEDAKAFQTTIDKIITLTNAQLPKRQFEGTTIYEIEIPEMPQNANVNVQLSGPISIAVAKDTLFIANPASMIEQVIRGGGASLRQTPGYDAVAAHYPKAASTLAFARPEEQARALYNMVKSGQLAQAIREAARNSGGELPEETLIDPAKLPDFSVFQKYMAPSGSYGEMEADGVTITQFTLKKDAP